MILITGGTGFLGAHLIYHLLQKVDKVRAIKRKDSSFHVLSRVFSFYHTDIDNLMKRIEWVEGDITDVCSLDPCFDAVTEVYHVAGKVSFLPADKGELMRINVTGTANVVNLALDKDVKKLLHVSSISAIGRVASEKVIAEATAWKTSGKNSMYAVSKYAAEKEVWRGMAEGLNAVIVNPSIILGVGEYETGSGRLIKTVEKGLKFYTNGVNGFVDVQDVAKVMILLMDSDISDERFIVSAENLSYKRLFEYIASGLGKPAPKFAAGKILSGATWRASALKSWLTGNKPFISREVAQTANNKYFYTSGKLISRTGYNFNPVKQTIMEICRHHREVSTRKDFGSMIS
ncbi:MAG: NAD-dependent epimerase/dehydratase family protein [Bacteroidales bacterium]